MDYSVNYYEVLGLDKNASLDDIKRQFKKLSKIYHPDVKPTGDENKFKEINNANSVLSDPKLKQEYDTRSPHGKSPNPFGGGFEFHFGGGGGLEDLLNNFFGPGGFNPFGGFGPFGNFREDFRENLDINLTININLKQIYLNDSPNLKYKKFVHCEDCDGSGFDKASHSETCDICNGSGINKNRTCEYCRGSGQIHTGTCQTCKGEKVILKDAEINMSNLFQIRNNIKNAYRGYGHQSKYYRERVGSLILNILIDRNDDYLISYNYDLRKTLDVHFQDAIDGAEIIFKHIDDSTIRIKLPTKTKNDNIIRVKEKGLLKNEKIRGDLYLKVNIIIDYERI